MNLNLKMLQDYKMSRRTLEMNSFQEEPEERKKEVILSILEHNYTLTSRLDETIFEVEAIKASVDSLLVDLEYLKLECETLTNQYEKLRLEESMNNLQSSVCEMKTSNVTESKRSLTSGCEETAQQASSQLQGQLQYKTGDDLQKLLARLCEVNRSILE